MVKMQIAIIEDQLEEAKILERYLQTYQQQTNQKITLAFYTSAEQFLKSLEENRFHLIFVDIYLNEMDGIEMAQKLNQIDKNCCIVFLTYSDDDIWRAVKIHACFDYIKKKELCYYRVEKILDDVKERTTFLDNTLNFSSGKQKITISLISIQYLVSQDKYTVIHLKNNKAVSYRVNFSTLYNLLENQKQFILCNRGVLLNMDYIDCADKESFVMVSGQRFAIRRSDRATILHRYMNYQFDQLNKQRIL